MQTKTRGAGLYEKNIESKSPTSIRWVDYLDIWAKSKISKNCNLDFLDFSSPKMKGRSRPWSPANNSKLLPAWPSN